MKQTKVDLFSLQLKAFVLSFTERNMKIGFENREDLVQTAVNPKEKHDYFTNM